MKLEIYSMKLDFLRFLFLNIIKLFPSKYTIYIMNLFSLNVLFKNSDKIINKTLKTELNSQKLQLINFL